ncbi:MAG: hypothetical protein HUJ56_04820 [Erysipelotrichaceae bacterium]|nr:hypothetical protein [Erysipelotrichaceae bacterium]
MLPSGNWDCVGATLYDNATMVAPITAINYPSTGGSTSIYYKVDER